MGRRVMMCETRNRLTRKLGVMMNGDENRYRKNVSLSLSNCEAVEPFVNYETFSISPRKSQPMAFKLIKNEKHLESLRREAFTTLEMQEIVRKILPVLCFRPLRNCVKLIIFCKKNNSITYCKKNIYDDL